MSDRDVCDSHDPLNQADSAQRSGGNAPGRNRTCGRFPPASAVRVPPLLPADVRERLSPEEKASERAARRHLRWRFQQDRFEALELGEETFLTVRYVQRLLRAVDAPRKGEKAAREALRWWQEIGILVDTGRTKKATGQCLETGGGREVRTGHASGGRTRLAAIGPSRVLVAGLQSGSDRPCASCLPAHVLGVRDSRQPAATRSVSVGIPRLSRADLPPQTTV
jgi:hypothetical protein